MIFSNKRESLVENDQAFLIFRCFDNLLTMNMLVIIERM